jgi:hypothetical protein
MQEFAESWCSIFIEYNEHRGPSLFSILLLRRNGRSALRLYRLIHDGRPDAPEFATISYLRLNTQ